MPIQTAGTIRRRRLVACVFAVCCFVLLSRPAQSQQGVQGSTADIILHNGKVWTVDSARPVAQAVAIRGSKIIKVGSDSEVLSLRGPSTRVVDLQGRLVLPGFNDAHTHFENATQWFFEVLVMDVNDSAELLRLLKEAADRVPKGHWITGTNFAAFAAWSAEKRHDSKFVPLTPDLAAVDAITPNNPVLLRRYDHVYFANSRALELAHITSKTRDPQGGRYERDPKTGKLNGMIHGIAGEQLAALLPPTTEADKLIGARGVIRELNRVGITSIHDIARVDAVTQKHSFTTYVERSYSDVNIFRDLRAANDLRVRVYAYMPLQEWRDLKDVGVTPGSGDEMIRYGVLKDFTDGTYMFQPYASDPTNSGGWTFRFPGEEVMARNIREADAAGFDIGIHVLGDKALHSLLDWYEAAVAANGPRDRRLRLIHAQFATEDDLKRAGRLHLIADITPSHLLNDSESIDRLVGPERAKTAFAWRTMINDGVRLDIVSDLPGAFNKQDISPFNPLENIYGAVTRKNRSGAPAGGWHPEQALTVEEAIAAYTANPAFASHEENIKGTITEGKLADLVVLSKDILSVPREDILKTDVIMTIFDGKVVFEK